MACTPESHTAQKPLKDGGVGEAEAGTNYEALLSKRNAKVAELEGMIAETAEAPRVIEHKGVRQPLFAEAAELIVRPDEVTHADDPIVVAVGLDAPKNRVCLVEQHDVEARILLLQQRGDKVDAQLPVSRSRPWRRAARRSSLSERVSHG